METEDLVHLEPPVFRAVARELHEGEQRILFVQHAVGREVQHASGRSEATKCRLGRRAAAQHLRIRPGKAPDRRHFLTRPRQRRGLRRKRQQPDTRNPRRPVAERYPDRRRRRHRQLVALDEKPPGSIHQRGERQILQLNVWYED